MASNAQTSASSAPSALPGTRVAGATFANAPLLAYAVALATAPTLTPTPTFTATAMSTALEILISSATARTGPALRPATTMGNVVIQRP